MEPKKILAICTLGGEFSTESDGSMSHSGGDAHAIDIGRDMTFNELKSEISAMFNCKADNYHIKYFLPNNRRTLITVSNDKDVQRMVDFHAGSDTTYIYILKKNDSRLARSAAAESPTFDAGTPVVTVPDGSKRQRVCAEWKEVITGLGQSFTSPKEFRDTLHKYAIANRFTYRFVKNDSTRVTAECTGEDCPWRIHASKSPTSKEFVIRKFSGNHTCRKDMVKSHRLASQRWIASVIKDKLRERPNYSPRDIANDLQSEYGLSLNYTQAWRGKSIAQKELFSSHAEACTQLPWFCDRIVETNPGSATSLFTLDDSKFRLFIGFHASLHGFEHGCCPLLFLDCVSPKPARQWKLLLASTVDGEGDVFPVAFSIVEGESQDSWHWFLEQLKNALTISRVLTFVSGGENGLSDVVPLLFGDSHLACSSKYLIEEFKTQLDDSWSDDVKDLMIENLKCCVQSCREDEFNHYVDKIREASESLADWVLEAKPERWSDAYFKGVRFGHYSSDAGELFLEWISTKYELSVVQMVDLIRCKLMEMMYTRRESSNPWAEVMTPSTNQKLQKEMRRAQLLKVVRSSGDMFEVSAGGGGEPSWLVSLEMFECTCRRMLVTMLPCVHALAVINHTGQSVLPYCSKYFSTEYYRETYSMSINPIPDVSVAAALGDPAQSMVAATTAYVTPVRTRRRVGRPKVKPADPQINIKRAVRCSLCKSFGHNKATCKTMFQPDKQPPMPDVNYVR